MTAGKKRAHAREPESEDENLPEAGAGDTEPPEPIVPQSRADFSPDMITRLLDRHAPKNGDFSRSPIRQRELTFTLSGESCTPGFLVDDEGTYIDVEITMRAIDSQSEIEAMKKVERPGEVAFRLAYAFLHKLNGRVLDEEQKRFLWEGLGVGGRHLIIAAYHQIGGAGDSAMGKFLRTVSVS